MKPGPRPFDFDLNPIYGTHRTWLEVELSKLSPGALVIEHGVGPYSSPLIARSVADVLAIEPAPGWADWARWFYAFHGKQFQVVGRAKQAVSDLGRAALVFIDGDNSERGDLVRWSLDAGAAVVIAHDTEDDSRKQYGYRFDPHPGYTIEHDGKRPRTTLWRRR